MNFKKYTAALLISGCLLTGCSASTVKDDGKYVVASLSSEDETKNFLADDLYQSLMDSSNGESATYNAVLQILIDNKFPISDEMEKDADDIIDQVTALYQSQYGDDAYEETLNQALVSNGYEDLDAYREAMIRQIQYANFLLDYIDNNYDNVFDDFYQTASPRYVSIIQVSATDVTSLTSEESQKLAEVNELLNNTEKSFGDIAQDYSDDTNTNSKKGVLGIVDANDTLGVESVYGQEVLEAAQSLNEGEVSQQITGTDGFYFVMVTSTNYDEMKEDLKDTDIDSPLLAYDDYLQYVVFNSYKFTYDDETIESKVTSFVENALSERNTNRGVSE